MSVFCKELNKLFDSNELMFKALIENKSIIIDGKKSMIYKSFEKGLGIVTNQDSIKKSMEADKALKFDDNYYYFVVNSANILDSHGDVHVDGNWNKTVKEQQGKVYLVFDHELKRSEIIAMRQDIEMFTAKVPFSLLGKSYEGDTYSLIYKVAKDKIINKEAKDWLEQGHKLEASVRMQYVDILLAVNSKDADMVKEKENFDTYYPQIANKNEVGDISYFWVVKQAKNIYESSLVLFGSNSATGVIGAENKEEAELITSTEPLENTQKGKVTIF